MRLVLLFLVACGNGTAPCPTVPERNCPAAPAAPDPVLAVELEEKTGPSPHLIGGPGFWCSERPPMLDPSSEPVTECYRTEETCELLRKRRLKAGELATQCERRERAVCFVMLDVGGHGTGFRCFATEPECQRDRPGYLKTHEGDGIEFTECEWTASVERRGRVAESLSQE